MGDEVGLSMLFGCVFDAILRGAVRPFVVLLCVLLNRSLGIFFTKQFLENDTFRENKHGKIRMGIDSMAFGFVAHLCALDILTCII